MKNIEISRLQQHLEQLVGERNPRTSPQSLRAAGDLIAGSDQNFDNIDRIVGAKIGNPNFGELSHHRISLRISESTWLK